MRAYQFLLEYDRSREQQRIESLPAYEQRIKQEPEFSLERLESGDPTPQKIYVPRLAQWWLAGEPIEDLISTTADALAKYHTLKNKKLIKPEHADIGRFKTADQFTDVVAKYQLPTDQPNQNRGKYKEIYRDAELLVVKLLDKTAAQFWGQNTKWCTAAKNNNQFSRYAKNGPLYVIIPRKDPANKYQLWWRKTNVYDIHFMNVEDKSANPQLLPFYQKLQAIMYPIHKHIMWNPNAIEQEQLDVLQKNGHLIKWIKNPSEQLQLAAVQQDGLVISYIQNPSEAVQMAAVQQNGGSIKYIKNPSEEMQLAAVQRNGAAIIFIKNPSEEMQLAAVQQNGNAIQYIKDPSEAVQMAAVQQNGNAIVSIQNPSEAVQLAAVQRNGAAIIFIKNPSEEMQLAAVQQNGNAIQYIKDPSEAVQMAAVKKSKNAFKYIKNPSEAVQMAAVKKK